MYLKVPSKYSTRHKPTNLRTVAASQPLLPNNEAQTAPIRGRMVGGGWGGSPAVTGWMSDVGAGDRDGDTRTPATGIHYTAIVLEKVPSEGS